MALIDRYIPSPHYRERHAIDVAAPAGTVIAAAAAYRTEYDLFFRWMIALREAPSRVGRLIRPRRGAAPPPFGIDAFTLLERSASEIVFGLAGRFWRPDFDLVPLGDGAAFLHLQAPGIAKLALNFVVEDGPEGKTTRRTETRILCVDRAARVRFAPYWYAIRPVSGLIRRRALKTIRRTCEGGPSYVAG